MDDRNLSGKSIYNKKVFLISYTQFKKSNMQGIGDIVIDLTRTQDSGEIVLAQTLHKSIVQLRQKLKNNRSQANHICYKIIFFPNTPICYANDKKKTKNNDYFLIKLNCKSLYPERVGTTNNYKMKHCSNGKQQELQFNPYYKGIYCVVEMIGILVAEQVRFNTLDLLIQQEKKGMSKIHDPRQLFEFFVKNYLQNGYRNWQNRSLKPNQYKDQIKVVVPFIS